MIRNGVVRAARVVHAKSVSTPCVSDSNNVELDPLLGCGSCSSAGGCGVSILPVKPASLILECSNHSGVVLTPGDCVQVEVSEPDTSWLGLVGQAYGLPTIGMLSGALVGDLLATQLTQKLPDSALSGFLPALGFVVGLTGGLIAWNRIAKSATSRSGVVDGNGRIVGVMLTESK